MEFLLTILIFKEGNTEEVTFVLSKPFKPIQLSETEFKIAALIPFYSFVSSMIGRLLRKVGIRTIYNPSSKGWAVSGICE